MTYRCCRCENHLSLAELSQRCSRAPDRGPHETLDVRQGSSLHVMTCPRSDPSPLMMAACECPLVSNKP
jgi:hypothetical protein